MEEERLTEKTDGTSRQSSDSDAAAGQRMGSETQSVQGAAGQRVSSDAPSGQGMLSDAADASCRIAVIVPVYNKERSVERCIRSILRQTYRSLELWLIDDGSTDGSGAVCDAAARADARVHVVHKQNEGLMRTWMRGVRESRAPYLCFVDSDDWIEPELLEHLAAGLTTETAPDGKCRLGRAEVVCGGYVIDREWNGTSEKKDNGAAPGVYEGEKLAWGIFSRILGNEERTVILSRCMKLFSRELIENNLHYCNPTIRMGEDVNIVLPALLDARRIVILPQEYGYHYVFERDSMVHRYDPGLYENVRLLREIIGTVLTDKGTPGARRMQEQEFLFLLLLAVKNELRSDDPESALRVQVICTQENTPRLLREYAFPMKETANRLIAFLMRRPTMARIMPVRLLFRLKG